MTCSWRKYLVLLCVGTFLMGQGVSGSSSPIFQGGLEGIVSDSISLEPVPGVKVELFPSTPDWQIISPSPAAETQTDEKGFYQFENLPAIHHLARFSKDGYGETVKKIQIQTTAVINLNVLLTPDGAPSPTQPPPQPKAFLHGRVTEYTGVLAVVPDPIPNTHIMVFQSWTMPGGQTFTEPQPPLVCEAYTNEEGLYEIPDIPFGSYHIVAKAEGYYAGKAMLEIKESDVEQNFELKKNTMPSPTPPPPRELGEIFGIVSAWNEDGVTTHPLAGATIEVFPAIPGCQGGAQGIIPSVPQAVTDENGFYDILYIPAGLWSITARAEGFLPIARETDIVPGESQEENFTLEAGEAPQGGVIIGHVGGEAPDGVCTLIPLSLEGAMIEVFDSTLSDPQTGEYNPGGTDPVAVVFTDQDGMYRVENLEKNRLYILRASYLHYYPQYKTATIYDDPVTVCFFLKYMSDPPPAPSGSVIKGRVFEKCFQTPDMKPIAGAMVKIQKTSASLDPPTSPPIVLYTDQEGFYIAENLEPGYYVMEVRAEGYYPGFRHALLGPDEIKIVHFALAPVPAEPTQTPLPDNGALSGTVSALCPRNIDGPTTPIAGALVSLYPLIFESPWENPDAVASAVTDESGQYQIPDIPPGSYVAVAEAAGFHRSMKKAIIPPGKTIILDFGLCPDVEPAPTPIPGMGNISGQVLGEGAGEFPEPLPGASVLLFAIPRFRSDIIPGPVRETTTDGEGKFFMEDVPAGDYVLAAKAEGYAPETTPVKVITGETRETTLILKPFTLPTPTPSPLTGTIEGHVAFDNGGELIPIPSARLFAMRLGNNTPDLLGDLPPIHTATDQYGYYKFLPLVEGRYLVVATAEGFFPAQKEGDVLPEQTFTMDFILQAADFPSTDTGILFGRVMTVDAPTTPGAPPNCKPLKDAEIVVLQVQQSLMDEGILVPAGRAVTDENGDYLVENLQAGMYSVIASKDGYCWSIKNARVRAMNVTRVNFLLAPLGIAPPDPGKTIVFENNFDETEENWQPAGVPKTFLMPQNSHEQGALRLACSDNLNTFGYWHSPADAVPLNENVIYKSSFSIRTDVTDPTKAPCIRIRFNSQSEQIADMMVINSLGDAVMSPGPAGRVYTIYFTLPSQDIHLPENENDIYVSFDMANMDPRDAQNAIASLDWIKIEALPLASLPQGTQVASLDFTRGSQGWGNQFAKDVFAAPEPLSAPAAGGLAFKSVNNTGTYGVWVSPPNLIPMQANALYAIRWDLYSDQLEGASVPGIRLRAGDDQNRLITQKCIFSNAEGDNSPTLAGGSYTLYYAAPAELGGAGLTLAFDLANFDKTDAPDGIIGARSVSVWAIPAEQLP